MTPGRNPSISASARSISRSTAATASGFFRSTAMLRRPRCSSAKARVLALAADVAPDIGGAIDPDHLGAHVGQQHRAERRRADPGQLDDPHPLKRSHLAFLPLRAVQLYHRRTAAAPPPGPPRTRAREMTEAVAMIRTYALKLPSAAGGEG